MHTEVVESLGRAIWTINIIPVAGVTDPMRGVLEPSKHQSDPVT